MSHREWVRRAGEKVWKRLARLAVLVVVALLPVSAVAHTKLFYRMSYRSDYWKVQIVEPMLASEPTEIPTVTPLMEIPLESTLTPEPTLAPTEFPTPTPSVEIIDTVDAEVPDQIFTPSDVDEQVDIETL